MEICKNNCEDSYLNCIFHCGVDACYTKCADDRNICLFGKLQLTQKNYLCSLECPCYGGCPNGCNGCDNVACYCTDPPTPENAFNRDHCIEEWGSKLGKCVVSCNGVSDCETVCIALFTSNIEYCPCEVRLH